MGKCIFQASAANGISNKLDYLTEVEYVLQFIIAPHSQFDTIIYLNYGSCFTYTIIYIIYICNSALSMFSLRFNTLHSVLTL